MIERDEQRPSAVWLQRKWCLTVVASIRRRQVCALLLFPLQEDVVKSMRTKVRDKRWWNTPAHVTPCTHLFCMTCVFPSSRWDQTGRVQSARVLTTGQRVISSDNLINSERGVLQAPKYILIRFTFTEYCPCFLLNNMVNKVINEITVTIKKLN